MSVENILYPLEVYDSLKQIFPERDWIEFLSVDIL